jgi:hypothetical protein
MLTRQNTEPIEKAEPQPKPTPEPKPRLLMLHLEPLEERAAPTLGWALGN